MAKRTTRAKEDKPEPECGCLLETVEAIDALAERVAAATGGRYFRARNTRQLEEIYQEIDLLEPVESDDRLYRPVEALFYWPLALSLLLALVILSLLAGTGVRDSD